MFCSLSSVFYFIGDKIDVDHFKDEITPSLEVNDGFNFSQNVAFDHVRDKSKPLYKLSYKVLKEEDG